MKFSNLYKIFECVRCDNFEIYGENTLSNSLFHKIVNMKILKNINDNLFITCMDKLKFAINYM